MTEAKSDTRIHMVEHCSITFGPFWWIGTTRSDGRGHKYVAIVLKTLDWLLWKVRGYDVGWRADSTWLDGGDGYNGLALTIRSETGVLYEASTHFPGWMHTTEMNMRRRWMHWRFRRHQKRQRPTVESP